LPRTLGYKRAYHGTDPEAAKSIREVGLKRSFGGSGVAGVDALVEGRGDVRELARKNVYVSGQKSYAKGYIPKATMIKKLREQGYTPEDLAAVAERPLADPELVKKRIVESLKATAKSKIPGTAEHGALVKMDLPMEMWSKAKADPLVARLMAEQADKIEAAGNPIAKHIAKKTRDIDVKPVAAIIGSDIDPRFIHGGAGRGKAILERMKAVPKYVAAHPKRFLKGVGGAGLGLGLLGGGGALVHRGLTNREA
jgi:hypothetical protein